MDVFVFLYVKVFRVKCLKLFSLIVKTLFNLQATNENLPPNVLKQLAKELKNLDETPPEGIRVCVNEDDFSMIFADIEGPGIFLLSTLNSF